MLLFHKISLAESRPSTCPYIHAEEYGIEFCREETSTAIIADFLKKKKRNILFYQTLKSNDIRKTKISNLTFILRKRRAYDYVACYGTHYFEHLVSQDGLGRTRKKKKVREYVICSKENKKYVIANTERAYCIEYKAKGLKTKDEILPIIAEFKGQVDFETFTNQTYGLFTPCPIPDRVPDYISASNSMYWFDKEYNIVYRLSDHWCDKVGSCNWRIKKDIYHFSTTKVKCGFIKLENLKRLHKTSFYID